MELRQLEYFVAVAEEASFTRAAERVHISQSGVSAQIRQLEHELGATLLDRSGRTTTVTTAGAAALEHARAVLTSVTAVRQAVDDVTGLIRGRLVIGMVTGCTITPLFDALAAFHLAHPGVEITLFEDNSDRLIDGVRTGATDLALIGAAGTPPAGLGALTIVSEPIVAVVPLGHPLAKRRRATLATVTGYPIVCLPEGTGIRTVFDQACAAKGIQPNIVLQASAPAAVTDLALRGFGVAIVSESMSTNHDGPLHAVTVNDIDTPAALALIWTTTTSPALQELLRHSHDAFTHPQAHQAPQGNSRTARQRRPLAANDRVPIAATGR
jgi:DNA-binding transcriptional LysR family regulator